MRFLLLAGMGWLAFSNFGAAQVLPVVVGTNGNSEIVCTGRALINVTPDVAQVRLGIEWQTNTALAAQTVVGETMTRAALALEQIGILPGAIRNSAIDITPIYSGPLGGDVSPISACRAAGTLEVTLGATQIDLVGSVVDAALRAGVNRLQGITFNVSSTSSRRSEALILAEQDAQAKAQSIARGLGLRIDGIDSVTDNGLTVSPATAPTWPTGEMAPIPGTLRMDSSVTLHYRFASKGGRTAGGY